MFFSPASRYKKKKKSHTPSVFEKDKCQQIDSLMKTKGFISPQKYLSKGNSLEQV